jgi:hypothetical protein
VPKSKVRSKAKSKLQSKRRETKHQEGRRIRRAVGEYLQAHCDETEMTVAVNWRDMADSIGESVDHVRAMMFGLLIENRLAVVDGGFEEDDARFVLLVPEDYYDRT